jgi:hypothetical protein
VIETLVLGWFTTAFLLYLRGEPDAFPRASGRLRRTDALVRGELIGCDWEHPKKHLIFYEGAVHLHNRNCVFEPPEER